MDLACLENFPLTCSADVDGEDGCSSDGSELEVVVGGGVGFIGAGTQGSDVGSQAQESGGRVQCEARMRERVRAASLNVVRVEGDGNCLYRAIAVCMGDTEDDFGQYRRMAEDGTEGDLREVLGDDVAQEEVGWMRANGEWGSEVAVAAIARVTGTRIRVITGLQNWEGVTHGPEGGREMCIAFNGLDHYWATQGAGMGVGSPGPGDSVHRVEAEQADIDVSKMSNKMLAESLKGMWCSGLTPFNTDINFRSL